VASACASGAKPEAILDSRLGIVITRYPQVSPHLWKLHGCHSSGRIPGNCLKLCGAGKCTRVESGEWHPCHSFLCL